MFDANEKIHKSDEQIKRQVSARKVAIKSIDRENNTGIINDYEVTLESCTCRDWMVRRLPCKHIYRLAHELGLYRLPGKEILEAKEVVLPLNVMTELNNIVLDNIELPFVPDNFNLILNVEVAHDGLTYSKNIVIKRGSQK